MHKAACQASSTGVFPVSEVQKGVALGSSSNLRFQHRRSGNTPNHVTPWMLARFADPEEIR